MFLRRDASHGKGTMDTLGTSMSQTIALRFWSKVEKLAECWIWRGTKTTRGYGHFRLCGRMAQAHRVAWYLSTNEWPSMCVCHRCDNPSCVRPEHLFLGTLSDNARDSIAKGRSGFQTRPERFPGAWFVGRGEDNPNARLTEANVRTIRSKLDAGESGAHLARVYGMSETAIRDIKHGRRWVHVS